MDFKRKQLREYIEVLAEIVSNRRIVCFLRKVAKKINDHGVSNCISYEQNLFCITWFKGKEMFILDVTFNSVCVSYSKDKKLKHIYCDHDDYKLVTNLYSEWKISL